MFIELQRGTGLAHPRPADGRAAQMPGPPRPIHQAGEAQRIADEFAAVAKRNATRGSRPVSPREVWRGILLSGRWEFASQADVAVHEAGHAVLMIDCGIRPAGAHVEENGDVAGATRFWQISGDAEQRAVFALAGAIAQTKFLREECRQPGAQCWPSTQDWELIRAVSGRERQRIERVATARVDWLWQAIRGVARSLVAESRLSGSRIVEVCKPFAVYFEPAGRALLQKAR